MIRYNTTQNPYWMVPAALEGTNATLKDLVTTHFANKEMERAHQAKLAELDLVRQKIQMAGDRDLASLGMEAAKQQADVAWRTRQQAFQEGQEARVGRQWEQDFGLRKLAEERQGRQFQQEFGLRAEAANREKALFAQKQREIERLNRMVTPEEAAMEFGMGSMGASLMADAMGKGGKRPLHEYQEPARNIMTMYQKNPKVAAASMMDMLEANLAPVMDKIEKGTALTPEETGIVADAHKAMRRIQMMTEDEPLRDRELVKVMEDAGQDWDDMVYEKQKDPSKAVGAYDFFMEKAGGDAKEAKRLFQENTIKDLNSIRTGSVFKDELNAIRKRLKGKDAGGEGQGAGGKEQGEKGKREQIVAMINSLGTSYGNLDPIRTLIGQGKLDTALNTLKRLQSIENAKRKQPPVKQ